MRLHLHKTENDIAEIKKNDHQAASMSEIILLFDDHMFEFKHRVRPKDFQKVRSKIPL